jgi:predicted ribosome-associated RNA-binding protein Tma20
MHIYKLIKVSTYFLIFSLSLHSYGQDEKYKHNEILIDSNGVLMWYNQPCAFELDKKLFVGYVSDKEVKISKFNREGLLENSKILKNWDKKYKDDHSAPAINYLNSGKNKGIIISAYAFHNTPLYFKRTSNPCSIERWEQEIVISDSACTYPSIEVTKDGSIYVFYAKNVSENPRTRVYSYKSSNDGGNSWSNEVELINFGQGTWVYAVKPIIKNNKLHITWSIYSKENRNVLNVYHFKLDLLKVAVDKRIPINEKNKESLIYKTDVEVYDETRVWDIILKNGCPQILAINKKSSEKATSIILLKKVKEKWKNDVVDSGAVVYYSGGAIFSENGSILYYSKYNKDSIAQIYKTRLKDIEKGNSNRSRFLKTESFIDSHNCRPQIVSNGKYFELIWLKSSNYEYWRRFFNSRVFAIKKDKNVWIKH